MNTELFTIWNVTVIAIVSVGAYWLLQRYAPVITNDGTDAG